MTPKLSRWWGCCGPVIPALARPKQEDHAFQGSLGDMASPCLRDREIEVGWGGDGERKFKSRVVEYGEAATVAAAFLIRGLPGNSNSSSVCHQGQLLSKHSGKLRVC